MVSHDETFINRVISGVGALSSTTAAGEASSRPQGELWVMSKQRLQRYDGAFRDYKAAIAKKVNSDLGL